jgi:hypothetical protein
MFRKKLSYGFRNNERENEGIYQKSTNVFLACVRLHEACHLVDLLRKFCVIEAFHFLVDGSTCIRDIVLYMAQQSDAVREVSW